MVISGCRLQSQSPGNTVFELAKFDVSTTPCLPLEFSCCMSETLVISSVISVCPSVSHLFGDTFCELVVKKFSFGTRITTILNPGK